MAEPISKTVHTKTIVASIDIGTAYTGYAYSFKTNPYDITVRKWTTDGIVSPKAPSSVLLTPELSFDSFGYEAEKKFSDLFVEKDHKDWHFVQGFKMALNEKQKFDINFLNITDIQNHFVPARAVFTGVIGYLKNDLMEQLTSKGHEHEVDNIQFVVTVPAIWSDAAKQAMVDSSVWVGIKKENLTIAYEPEVAAVHCLTIPANQVTVRTKENIAMMFQPGCCFLVLDLGGGKADITVQKVERDGKLSQLYAASGGSWGGSCVNNSFFQDLKKNLGDRVYQEFMKKNVGDYFHLRNQFEKAKRNFKNDQEMVSLHLPSSLEKITAEICGKNIGEILKDLDTCKSLAYSDGKLKYTAEYFKTFFFQTIQSTVDQIRKVLKSRKCNEVKYILMIGGFSESDIVRTRIKETFPGVQVIMPEDAALSVLKGGVLFGHAPDTVRFRVCPQTYGISMHDYFNPNVHDFSKSCKVGNVQFVVGCFEKIFEKDEVIEVGQKRKIRVAEDFTEQPENARTQNKEIEMYSSVEKDPKFVSDPGCMLQSTIVVSPPGGRWPDVVKGKITFEVTVTGLKVSFKDRNTKCSSGGEIKFTEPSSSDSTSPLNRSFRKDVS
ncbi:heat shock 70 kDa protein 12A-like [Saccostrea echinata]|uniref:heat shock 70 kDa protein 12A-like n=1 Tax=Saccostrea echinata TaxID=191078 RepID=UPI002A802487|nr:heat shock 70 kDa protein 12A-like [Saccostrea echinata]